MTREKAIEIMQINRDGVANMSRSEDRTKTLAAFDMAIKALEQEPCDAISRQEAIDALWETLYEYDDKMKKLTPQPKTGHWIPVSEGLPYIGERVLVTTETLDSGKKVTGTYYDRYGFVCGNVLAWMPLPEPYKAESEGT